MSRPLRILGFWPAADFDTFFEVGFLNRPEYEVEIVSGNRTSGPSPYAMDGKRRRELRRRLEAGEFDLVISGNIWNTPWPCNKGFWTSAAQAMRFFTYKRLMLDTWWAPSLVKGLTDRVPFAVVDLRDPHYLLPWDERLLTSCTHYFKRELFAWHRRSMLPLYTYVGKRRLEPHESKLLPLSYGVDGGQIPAAEIIKPMAERDIDLFITGFGNPVRNHIRERCMKLASRYKVVTVEGKVSSAEYTDHLNRSKLVVCTESYGCETWRQYEAAAYGAVPLINYPFVLHHQPMVPDEHAVFFSLAGEDFEHQIDRALSSPALLEKISRQTRQHTIEHKDRRRIADYIVNTALNQGHGPGPT